MKSKEEIEKRLAQLKEQEMLITETYAALTSEVGTLPKHYFPPELTRIREQIKLLSWVLS